MDSILVVHGNPELRREIETILAGNGYHVTSTDSPLAAAEFIRTERFHLLLVDPELDTEGLTQVGSAPLPVLRLIKGQGEAALADLRLASSGSLCSQIAREIEFPRALAEREALRSEDRRAALPGILESRNVRMLAAIAKANEFAGLSAPVLIIGETGTGREALARNIHDASNRANGPFIRLCSGDAAEARYLAADHGTLYVDDAESLGARQQAALLQIIQERAFHRREGGQVVHTNTRVVMASRGQLDAKVREGFFRAELLGCLLPCVVEVPALRERPEDITNLARTLLRTEAARLHRPAPQLAQEAADALAAHTWPGNALELAAVMTRAVIAAGDSVEVIHLGIRAPQGPLKIAVLEREAIERALVLTQDNRTQAARMLGVSVRTLQYRLKEYGIKWEGLPRRDGIQVHPHAAGS